MRLRPNQQLSGRFCPYCLRALVQVVDRPEVEYCPIWDLCDYEVAPTGKQPLTASERRDELLKRKHEELQKLVLRHQRLSDEITELLKS